MISQKLNKLKKMPFLQILRQFLWKSDTKLSSILNFFTVQIIVVLKESWYWGLLREFESEAPYTSVGPSCGSLPIQEVLAREEKVAYNI